MTAQAPSPNDNEFSLLKKLVLNTAILVSGNPITAPASGVSGTEVLSIMVADKYSNLPLSLTTAPVDSVILVVHSEGVWPITDHSSGFYIRRGAAGQLSDWEAL